MMWIESKGGSCDIVPISAPRAVKTYINRDRYMKYDFMVRATFPVSRDNSDNINVDNMKTLREWQEWIDQQNQDGTYPDFGPDCHGYRLENAANMPQLAQLINGNMARYQFPAVIYYYERST